MKNSLLVLSTLITSAHLIVASGLNPHEGAEVTALHVAAKVGDLTTLQHLLDKTTNASPRDFMGYTPLHYAAGRGHIDLVDALINAGAQIDIQSNPDQTPLLLAAKSNRMACVIRLLDAGADTTIADFLGQSPLHTAVRIGRPVLCATLIKAGAPVNARDRDKKTPLHWIVESMIRTKDSDSKELIERSIDCIKLLSTAGADLNALDNKGITPLRRAEIGAIPSCIQCLIGEGALVTSNTLPGMLVMNNAIPVLKSLIVNSYRVYCPNKSIVHASRIKLKTALLSLRFAHAGSTIPKTHHEVGSKISNSHLILRTIFLGDAELRQDLVNILLGELHSQNDIFECGLFDVETRLMAAQMLKQKINQELILFIQTLPAKLARHQRPTQRIINDLSWIDELYTNINAGILALKKRLVNPKVS